jgi:Protein of unknown function (DUF3102)
MANIVRKPHTRAQWAARIRAAHKKTVRAFLKLGRTLLAAKKALPHGEFLKMIEHDLPFTASTAQRLMKIAADPKIANAAHAQLLPPAWGALYELTKLPAATFEQAAASGTIHPEMTRAAAVRVVKLRIEKKEKPLRIASVSYSTGEPKPLFFPPPPPEVIEAVPLHLQEKLQRLEELATDLSMSVQQHGGLTADIAKRIRAVADRLLSLIEQEGGTATLQ